MTKINCEICKKVMDKKDYPHYSYNQFINRRFCSKKCMWKDEEQALEYQDMKKTFLQNIDLKLDVILSKLNTETEEKPETEKIKFCDGRTVEKGVKNG